MQEKITVDHQDVKKLQDVFIEDLERKVITFDIVRKKMGSDPQLFDMSPGSVYDRLKKELCQKVTAKPQPQEAHQNCLNPCRMTAHSSEQTSFKT